MAPRRRPSSDYICRALANAAGAVVVSIEYRLAPEHVYPAGYDDCVAGFVWAVANAEELGGDASRIAVAGDSAGGNLAAAVALWARENSVTLSAQVLIYPACNLAEPGTESYFANADGYLLSRGWMDWFIDQYLPDPADRLLPSASPALASSHAGLAPAIVITAEFDPLRDDGKNYADTLTAAGVPVVHALYAGGPSG